MFLNICKRGIQVKRRIKRWLDKNTVSLKGKTVAVSGATGGLGRELCFYLAHLNARIVIIARNYLKVKDLCRDIKAEYPECDISHIIADLESIESAKNTAENLKETDVDILIHNAGAYAIPKEKCKSGYLNVFQINFIWPYYITKALIPFFKQKNGRVVVVGSIAHNYSKTDFNDIDFSLRESSALCYGNSKRFLMFSHEQLLKQEDQVILSITHPGISFTGITAHYPKWLFTIIKYPMKLIFMKPKIAALSTLKGIFCETKENEWYAPRIFGIWGTPVLRKINTAPLKEREQIYITANKICEDLIENEYP